MATVLANFNGSRTAFSGAVGDPRQLRLVFEILASAPLLNERILSADSQFPRADA
jgi:hypothetical protein